MPVTRITVVVFQDPFLNNFPEFITRMKTIREHMNERYLEERTRLTFSVYRQVESLKVLYVFGEWSSLEAHNELQQMRGSICLRFFSVHRT
jgi:quinol monooxygenase YgiN